MQKESLTLISVTMFAGAILQQEVLVRVEVSVMITLQSCDLKKE